MDVLSNPEQESLPYLDILREMFPMKTLEAIKNVILLVREASPLDSEEQRFENITDLLCEPQKIWESNEDGASNSSSNTNSIPAEEDLADEAVGYSRILSESELGTYFERLTDIFPNACPTFLRNFCHENSKTFIGLETWIDEISQLDYPKKAIDPYQTYQNLCDMLPNADPSYLKQQADILAYRPELELKQFVENAFENEDYPTLNEYNERQAKLKEKDRYTSKFSIKLFLEDFPDPEAYFSNPSRPNPLARIASNENKDEQQTEEEKQQAEEEEQKAKEEEEAYALNFLLNQYVFLRSRDIEKVFTINKKNLYRTCTRLDGIPRSLKTPRRKLSQLPPPENIPLLQEIAFLKNRKLLRSTLKERDEKYRLLKQEATKNGLLQTCGCCFDEELIPEECYFCNDGCTFCKLCIKKGAETVIGDGKLEFPCLANCGADFSFSTLQMVLDRIVFSRMFQRKQIEEIKNANLDGLETCPFCDFANIPPEDDKIFNCLNPDCMKKSCRECRHEAHIPLRCNEIEYDEDVKMRTFIENKMTEALLRECWQCKKKFIKESGCNKMTCSCGARMCYICKQRVDDYTHFGDNGRCPLYTHDLDKFHENIVIQGGLQAKTELGVDRQPNKLKKDPMRLFREE